ncbi:glycerate kinase [Mesorhizobium sp. M7A.F.Ca.US.006.01.1.1]|uniref:glycerate kinase type-2 family protein n=1 Tax=Mesorhizobium sp. M7A.F.Ca.US.006.01.1.1 TaxID=2496707 RepID=UPI000FCAECCC|nr:glycerate kinase [Mesorhizobium sp. M7A.F.Ca.US.006.01.1.1]RUZ72307.1 glycerate kinase [Mesorhizobium sp. M7A.F.Ca.US.006.01.1.1]
MNEPRAFLANLFQAAIDAASPGKRVAQFLPARPKGRTIVVGAGKAAAAMAAAVEAAWDGPLGGLVVTRYGHGAPTKFIEVVEASHPLPDAAGEGAALRILDRVRGLSADDLVLCLISGGGSALLAAPAPGLTIDDKRSINRALLRCGASISEMNCVRKHLSAIKGGHLALAASPAQVVSLIISDVPGDDHAVVASGPTVADASSSAEALAILRRYAIEAPANVVAHLRSPQSETPKPGHSRFQSVENIIISAPQRSLEAAAVRARAAGVTPVLLGDAIEGEAREVAKVMAGIARSAKLHGEPARAPCVLLSGGEATVTMAGQGRGGRNAEFLLGLAVALDSAPGIYAIAGDTDGIDGSEDNAGAHVAPDTLARAAAFGFDAKDRLADNDAYTLFAGIGDLVVTGPTRTNVNDFRAILVL